MSLVRLVSPDEAKALLDAGYGYLDVRSEPEFEAGHPPSAFNVPLFDGTEYNEEFLPVVLGNFPKETPLVLGCKSGASSRRAGEILALAGYTQLANSVSGWEGNRDAFGRLRPGWCRRGLPSETGRPSGRSYVDLVAKKAELAARTDETA